jgi:4-amino-4-deoxy-L-arabinose transferase-like glycosyltransferase
VSDRRLLGVVLAIAFACRVVVWLAALPDPTRYLSPPDSPEYVSIAHNLVAGHGFSADASPPYQPDLRRTPTYPSLLAAVFLMRDGSVTMAALVGVVLSAVAVAATFWIAARLFGRGAAIAASVLLAIDVSTVSYGTVIMTEAAFTFLLLAGVMMLMLRPSASRLAAGGGALFGLAALCRPAGVFLSIVSLAICAWRQTGRRRALRDYVWVNLVFLLLLLMWVARNTIVADTTTLSSIWSVNLYFHRAAAVEARLLGQDPEQVQKRWQQEFDALSSTMTESEKLEWMTGQARSVIASHPWTYLQITIDGFVRMMKPDASELHRLLDQPEGSSGARALDTIAALQLWIFYPAVIVGIVTVARDSSLRGGALIPLAFIASFILVSGPEAYARFRVPITPFLAMLGGVGIEQVLRIRDYRFLTRAKIRSYFPSTTSQR